MMSRPLSYLAIGDSYTIGELVETNQRWPMHLVKLFDDNKIKFSIPVFIAHTGATSGEILQLLDLLQPTGTFDLVSLLIGVNNQYRNYSIDEFKIEFTHLINKAIQFAGNNKKKVVVVSIPDWAFTPFGKNDTRGPEKISEQIDLFNGVCKSIANEVNIKFIDITSISRTHDESYLTTDSLHPSGKQYALWAAEVYGQISNLF